MDGAVINGALSGYEIKSARDTLRHLPGQIEMYSRVFDFVTIVVASNHFKDAIDAVPDWWSVVRAHDGDADVVLTDERDGSANPRWTRALPGLAALARESYSPSSRHADSMSASAPSRVESCASDWLRSYRSPSCARSSRAAQARQNWRAAQ